MSHNGQDEPLAGKRAAIMVGPQFEDTEALYPLYRLREAGAQVGVIGSEAGTTVPGKKGHELEVEQAAGDLSQDSLDLLVIAGGYGPDKLRTDEGVLALVRDMHAAGKPIAFICHAGWVPASAGIVAGKRVTSVQAIADDLRNAGAEWEDSEVVVDGNLISSRRPDDLPAFMRATIEVAAGVGAPA
ncbi:MAG TPA: type 1 glutamine amidotransferase domain-containing protein [Thermoleophilaceae bacterium]|jgi:protease I